MICKSQAFVGSHMFNTTVSTWNGDVSFVAEEFLEPAHDSTTGPPTGLSHLVFAVARATDANKRLMTVGSAWAFENLIQSDAWMLSLKRLDRRLEYVTGSGGQGLTDEWRLRQFDGAGKRRLVHIEAGIEVGALNEILQANDGEPWALPVLGGANGQSLAGAISTSTHGGNWQQPPFPDLVRAFHIVTDGGHEIWLEKDSEPITRDDRLTPLLPCPDTRIVRNDELFNAAMVSFGRFGVIYSVVLEVTKAFNVAEVVTVISRESALQALSEGRTSARPLDPLFTLLDSAPLPQTIKVRDEAVGDPLFCQLVFSSQDTTSCWAQRRWTTNESQPLNLPTAPAQVFPMVEVVAALSALYAAWNLGIDVGGLVSGAIGGRFKDSMTQGRRGPHYLLTSGTREESHNIPYRADSIEVIFGSDDSNFVSFLESVLYEARNYKQAGYISIRPSLASRATLSMHNVRATHAYSVEVSTIKQVPDSKAWMHFVHSQALVHGGRPHWGQYNKLDASSVHRLYGNKIQKWHHALWAISGESDRFSSDFTRHRGLDPSSLRHVKAVFRTEGGALTHLLGTEGADWSPINVRDAMIGIGNGMAMYVVKSAEALTFVEVVNNPRIGGWYLRTVLDGIPTDNLSSLPLASGPIPAMEEEADFISQSCPVSISAGRTSNAKIVMLNSGTSVWEQGPYTLVHTADSEIHIAPVALAQSTSPLQKIAFSFPILAGAAGTRGKLVCRLAKNGQPFGSSSSPFMIVFTDPNEPDECVKIRERIVEVKAQIAVLKSKLDELDPDGDLHAMARIRSQIVALNGTLSSIRKSGEQLGCTLP